MRHQFAQTVFGPRSTPRRLRALRMLPKAPDGVDELGHARAGWGDGLQHRRPPRRVPERLQRQVGFHRAHEAVGTLAIRFVDHENIRNLHDARFQRLNLIACAGHERHDRNVGGPDDVHLILPDADEGPALVRELFARSGRASLVGITGAPGAGKSTLVDGLVSRWRKAGKSVGVLAVDPTSPFSGGAMLGDRVRMQAHAQDAAVFIRSMATRGHLGGLARATTDAALVLDAAGKDIVAIETVGVGQDEIEIARTADVSVLVLVPGMGDDVQALKAGVMEIADVFVVNKADRDGADRAVAEVETLLGLQTYAEGQWRPTIVQTEATTGRGLDDVVENISLFLMHAATVESRRRERAETQLRAILGARLMRQIESRVSDTEMGNLINRIVARTVDPYSAADEILNVKS